MVTVMAALPARGAVLRGHTSGICFSRFTCAIHGALCSASVKHWVVSVLHLQFNLLRDKLELLLHHLTPNDAAMHPVDDHDAVDAGHAIMHRRRCFGLGRRDDIFHDFNFKWTSLSKNIVPGENRAEVLLEAVGRSCRRRRQGASHRNALVQARRSIVDRGSAWSGRKQGSRKQRFYLACWSQFNQALLSFPLHLSSGLEDRGFLLPVPRQSSRLLSGGRAARDMIVLLLAELGAPPAAAWRRRRLVDGAAWPVGSPDPSGTLDFTRRNRCHKRHGSVTQ
mmetsp:Transcript_73487/g.160947  ORF Transcript_73487/g.160947 Transcript_73487/m.160947 type:complete len:280 (-) Transcript_73487:104-943(-)